MQYLGSAHASSLCHSLVHHAAWANLEYGTLSMSLMVLNCIALCFVMPCCVWLCYRVCTVLALCFDLLCISVCLFALLSCALLCGASFSGFLLYCAVLCCPVLCASVRHSSSPHWLWNLISSLLLSVTLPFPQQRREVHPLDPSLGKHNPVPVIFPKQRSLPYIKEGGAENMQHAKPNGWKKNILCWNFCGLRLKAETKCFAQLRFIPLHSLPHSPPSSVLPIWSACFRNDRLLSNFLFA